MSEVPNKVSVKLIFFKSMLYFHENNILVYPLSMGCRLSSYVVEEYEPIVHKIHVC